MGHIKKYNDFSLNVNESKPDYYDPKNLNGLVSHQVLGWVVVLV